jgi:DNA-binding NarL/FixJ family response regulator
MIDPDARVALTRADRPRRPRRVLLTTHRPLIAAGLHAVLSEDPDICVVGDAATGEAALAAVEQLLPDVVVVDEALRESGGLIHQLRRRNPQAAVILLAARDDPRLVLDAIDAGATGFVRLESSAAELRTAIQTVSAGGTALSQSLVERCLRALAFEGGAMIAGRTAFNATGADQPSGGVRERLTGREWDVLALIAAGQSNKEIASSLGIGVGTVKTHVEHAFQKLQVADRTQAAVQAVAMGLV